MQQVNHRLLREDEPTVEKTRKAATDIHHAPGTIDDPMSGWAFEYDPTQVPLTSSSRKRVYQGDFSRASQSQVIPARAVAFVEDSLEAYGAECAAMGQLASVGVGPRLFAIAYVPIGLSHNRSPILIEEDAGLNLARMISQLTTRANRSEELVQQVLHAPGTSQYETECLKIAYDVRAQLMNAHAHNVYHQDLRAENVCVRRFGPNPGDIRATVIDFELGTGAQGGTPRARASLYHTLFHTIPSRLAGAPLTIKPSPLETDMAYLAAFEYQLARGSLHLSRANPNEQVIDDFLEFVEGTIDYFGYPISIVPLKARHIHRSLDLDQLADTLGLIPVNRTTFPSEQLLEHARTYHRPHLDAMQYAACLESPAGKLATMIDQLARAKFETYKALRVEQGKPVIYERFEDQPDDLQKSTVAQAEHIPAKIETLGYRIVPIADCEEGARVRELTHEQIELLARIEHARWIEERSSMGWRLDSTITQSDPERRLSPYMVPYDELDDSIKEYDRDAVRQTIPLLERAGLVVTR